MTFFKELLRQFGKLKWWEFVVLGLLLTRLYRWEGDEDIVPAFVKYKYTYHAVWYFIHMRLIESILFFSLFYRTEIFPLLTLSLWGMGKIFDELVEPFHYYRGEIVWQILSLYITYVVYRWIQKQKKKQQGWEQKLSHL